MKEAICKEVIVTKLKQRGNGTENDPARIITQVWEKDGTLIAESDPWNEKFDDIDMIRFATNCIKNSLKSISMEDLNLWKIKMNMK